MKFLNKNHLKYALYLCAVLVVCLTIMELTGNNKSFDGKSPVFALYQFVAPAVIWYFGIKNKKKEQGGQLTFKQGLSEGFKISLVFGLISPFIFIAYYFINPTIQDYVRTAYQMPDAPLTNVLILDMFAQFISAIVFGSLYAAIISLFLRAKQSK